MNINDEITTTSEKLRESLEDLAFKDPNTLYAVYSVSDLSPHDILRRLSASSV